MASSCTAYKLKYIHELVLWFYEYNYNDCASDNHRSIKAY